MTVGTGARRCLVVGSYPPVPGPAAAATVAAVRRAWARGQEVVVVSPRPSAAPLVMPVAGAGVGRALARLRRQAEGRQSRGPGLPSGCSFSEVVLCLEPGWPLGQGRRPGPGLPAPRAVLERAGRSLAAALSGFAGAELVVTGDLGVPDDVLALLWPAVQCVTANSDEVAAALRRAGAPAVSVAEPYAGAGLGAGPVPGRGGVVNPLEPAEWLLLARGRRLVGRAARKVLGPRAPAVRAYLQRTWMRARSVPRHRSV